MLLLVRSISEPFSATTFLVSRVILLHGRRSDSATARQPETTRRQLGNDWPPCRVFAQGNHCIEAGWKNSRGRFMSEAFASQGIIFNVEQQ
jgi:hypothetical protein